MDHHENFQLREPGIAPTSEILEMVLGESDTAYKALQAALPALELEQSWQWYTPYKAWFAKGQYVWITQRGMKKEKTLYWLYVYDGYFSIAVWFKEKNRETLLSADISEETKQRICGAETMGKLPTFPVIFEIRTADTLTEVYTLLAYKKEWEK